MVTTPLEYNQFLYEIEWDHQGMQTNVRVPSNSPLYEINLNTRTINAPETLGVQGDHMAERVYFKIDRFYETVDLAQMSCVVMYTTPDNKDYAYVVPFFDITTATDKIIFPWDIQSVATEKSGIIKFAVKFFSTTLTHNIPEVTYELNTLVATSSIQKGQGPLTATTTERTIQLDEAFWAKVDRIKQSTDLLQINWIDVF